MMEFNLLRFYLRCFISSQLVFVYVQENWLAIFLKSLCQISISKYYHSIKLIQMMCKVYGENIKVILYSHENIWTKWALSFSYRTVWIRHYIYLIYGELFISAIFLLVLVNYGLLIFIHDILYQFYPLFNDIFVLDTALLCLLHFSWWVLWEVINFTDFFKEQTNFKKTIWICML